MPLNYSKGSIELRESLGPFTSLYIENRRDQPVQLSLHADLSGLHAAHMRPLQGSDSLAEGSQAVGRSASRAPSEIYTPAYLHHLCSQEFSRSWISKR